MGGLPREVSQLNQLLSIPFRGPTWGPLFNGGPRATCHRPTALNFQKVDIIINSFTQLELPLTLFALWQNVSQYTKMFCFVSAG